jgi:hypothetical protein
VEDQLHLCLIEVEASATSRRETALGIAEVTRTLAATTGGAGLLLGWLWGAG